MDSEIRIHVVLGTRDRARGSEAGKGRQQMEHLHRLVITVGSKGSAPLGRVQGPVPGSRVEGEEAGAFISRCRLSMRGCLPCVAWRVPVTRESHQVFFNGGADDPCRWKGHSKGGYRQGVHSVCSGGPRWEVPSSVMLGRVRTLASSVTNGCLLEPLSSAESTPPNTGETHAFAGGWGLHPPDL